MGLLSPQGQVTVHIIRMYSFHVLYQTGLDLSHIIKIKLCNLKTIPHHFELDVLMV